MTKKKSKDVSASPWKDRQGPSFRSFPGPRGAGVPLRVAISRSAYGEITGHAQGSLDREVCGVLAGEFCEDDEGPFVDVRASVRGSAAREAPGHVTFTHDTWNSVHATLEREHPALRIVGWYHTHPGFGVELSDMDTFIQSNFFPMPQQIALVMDPLGGEVGLAMNGPEGAQSLDRFWVDGREHRAQVAAGPRDDPASTHVAGDSAAALETRVSQLVAEVHDLRASLSRFLLILALGLGLGIVTVVGYAVKRVYFASVRPPREISFSMVPIVVKGKPSLLGVQVVTWEIPEELLRELESEPGPGEEPDAETPPDRPLDAPDEPTTPHDDREGNQ